MRATLASTLITVFFAGTPLLASQPHEQDVLRIYGAGACAAPSYGALQPGCCQCQPNCCDDVWAGYCQKKKQGFCLPCVRPQMHRCVHVPPANCGPGMSQVIVPGTPEIQDAPVESQPTPAPQLPPPPSDPPKSESAPPESKSPSDTTEALLPLFNPTAWRISIPVE